MDFLLRQSFDVLPIAAVATPLWIALTILAVIWVVSSRRVGTANREKYRFAWLIEIGALVVIIPIVMLKIANQMRAHNTYADSSYAGYATIALNAVAALAFTQMLVGAWLVWRHRNRPRSTVIATAVALCWTAGVLFTSDMAITGRWL